ncbi:cytidine deaminase [Oscillospiraceae bacterium MB08-C2-2]|nr:cytidine deaminase [Oscillospiraceae bacterium MB08-C2-2]
MGDYELVRLAWQARERAYCPYSGYGVGAALLAESGRVYQGCNVENAAYPVSSCGERSALFAAVSAGERHFSALAIVGGPMNNPAEMITARVSPCGVCRQALYEFEPQLRLLLVTGPDTWEETTLEQLLPDGFGPQNME